MTVLDRVAMKAATAYARLTMASPIYRDGDSQFEMTVAAVSDLGGGMRRITFSADELRRLPARRLPTSTSGSSCRARAPR